MSANPSPNTFTCHVCGETFEQGWTDDEAYAEAVLKFGPIPRERLHEVMGVVCDDCLPEVDAWLKRRGILK